MCDYLYEVNMGVIVVGIGLNVDFCYIENVVKYLVDISGLLFVYVEYLVDVI